MLDAYTQVDSLSQYKSGSVDAIVSVKRHQDSHEPLEHPVLISRVPALVLRDTVPSLCLPDSLPKTVENLIKAITRKLGG